MRTKVLSDSDIVIEALLFAADNLFNHRSTIRNLSLWNRCCYFFYIFSYEGKKVIIIRLPPQQIDQILIHIPPNLNYNVCFDYWYVNSPIYILGYCGWLYMSSTYFEYTLATSGDLIISKFSSFDSAFSDKL